LNLGVFKLLEDSVKTDVCGSYISADERIDAPSEPPRIKTLPSGKSVAVCPYLGLLNEAGNEVKLWDAWSKISAEDNNQEIKRRGL